MSLTPADHARLRSARGEFMEGVEVVTITRADLDALLPREVTTVEELNALPVGSVLLDSDPAVVEKFSEGAWICTGVGDRFGTHLITLPAIVLHTPGATR